MWRKLRAVVPRADLVASLTSLAEQGYTLDDVACMFGVSRERVRQWYERDAISRPHSAVVGRMWDDATNRFISVRSTVILRRRTSFRKAQRRERVRSRRADRRRRIIALLQDLAATLGRTPTVGELAERWFTREMPKHQHGSLLCGAWGRPCTLTEIWVAAGLTPRELGARGHLEGSPVRPSLTDTEVRECRALTTNLAGWAREHGVHPNVVYAIRCGANYKGRGLAPTPSGTPSLPSPPTRVE